VLPDADKRLDNEGNFKSWWARIPAEKQEKLKTGYEPILAKKNMQSPHPMIAVDEVDE